MTKTSHSSPQAPRRRICAPGAPSPDYQDRGPCPYGLVRFRLEDRGAHVGLVVGQTPRFLTIVYTDGRKHPAVRKIKRRREELGRLAYWHTDHARARLAVSRFLEAGKNLGISAPARKTLLAIADELRQARRS